MENNDLREELEAASEEAYIPQWRKPTFSILDTESGTLATVGRFSDGTGSTS